MVHFDLYTALVEPLWGASIRAATSSEKPCFLMVELLGAKHEDSDSEGSGELARWKAESLGPLLEEGWRESERIGPPGPKTKACLANLGQSESFCDNPDPLSLKLPEGAGRLEGMHKRSDAPRTSSGHLLPRLPDPGPVTQTGAICDWTWSQTSPLAVGATWNTTDWKPGGRETIRSESLDCAEKACWLSHLSDPECALPLTLCLCDGTRTGVSKGRHRESLTSYPRLFM